MSKFKFTGTDCDIKNEMLESVIEFIKTYYMLKRMFETYNPPIWGSINAAFLTEPKKSIKIIEKATGMTIDEVLS